MEAKTRLPYSSQSARSSVARLLQLHLLVALAASLTRPVISESDLVVPPITRVPKSALFSCLPYEQYAPKVAAKSVLVALCAKAWNSLRHSKEDLRGGCPCHKSSVPPPSSAEEVTSRWQAESAGADKQREAKSCCVAVRLRRIRDHISIAIQEATPEATDREMALAIKAKMDHEYAEFAWTVLVHSRDQPGSDALWKASFSNWCDQELIPRECEQRGGSLLWLTPEWHVFIFYVPCHQPSLPDAVFGHFKEVLAVCTEFRRLAIFSHRDLEDLVNCLIDGMEDQHGEPRGVIAWCSSLHDNRRMAVASDGRVIMNLGITLHAYDPENPPFEFTHSKILGVVLLPDHTE